jgi:prophage tail gpP-like protein
MITLEINGSRFDGFTDISVFRSVETISGSFSFSATSDNVITFPIKAGDPCKVLVGNDSAIDGFVESLAVSYDSGTHSIATSGRDKTCDAIDSSVIGKKEFVGPISLKSIIETTLADNKITGVSVINQAGTVENFKEGEFFSAEIGETVFEFIEKYARKRQVLLTTDGKGNILLARAGVTASVTTLQNVKGGTENNILSASINYDFTDRFNTYTMESQLNPSANPFGASVSNANTVKQSGGNQDNKIRPSRQLQLMSGSSDNSGDLANLATWHANLRRARSTDYNVVVHGFYQDEAQTNLWVPNQLVQVADEFADVSATLLIRSVEYNFNLTGGSTTTLSLVDKDAYTLEANISNAEARVNDKGSNLIFGG